MNPQFLNFSVRQQTNTEEFKKRDDNMISKFGWHHSVFVISKLLVSDRTQHVVDLDSRNMLQFVFLVQQPPVGQGQGQGLLIHEVSGSHTTHHGR